TRFLRVVRMANRAAKLIVQFGAVENHLSGVDRFYRLNWHSEFARVLDVDDHLGPAAGSDSTDRAIFFTSVGQKCLKSALDVLFHDLLHRRLIVSCFSSLARMVADKLRRSLELSSTHRGEVGSATRRTVVGCDSLRITASLGYL